MDGSTPVEGADVVFQDRDGAVVATVRTDASGEATHAPCAADSMITFRDPSNLDTLKTFAGVMPQQTIVYGDPTVAPVSITINTDAATAPAAAANYRFTAACAEKTTNASSHTLARDPGCMVRNPTVASALVRALDADDKTIGFASAQDVPLPSENVVANAGPWVGVDSHTLHVTNLPTTTGYLHEIGFGFWMNGRTQQPEYAYWLPSFVASRQGDFARPLEPVSEGYVVSAMVMIGASESRATRMIAGPVPASTELDFAAVSLPPISGTDMLVDDPTRPVATVTTGDMSRADGGSAVIIWERDGTLHSWEIVFPSGPTSIKYPALPPELADAGPTQDSVLHTTTVRAEYWRAEGVSYADVIEQGLTSAEDDELRLRATETAISFFQPY